MKRSTFFLASGMVAAGAAVAASCGLLPHNLLYLGIGWANFNWGRYVEIRW